MTATEAPAQARAAPDGPLWTWVSRLALAWMGGAIVWLVLDSHENGAWIMAGVLGASLAFHLVVRLPSLPSMLIVGAGAVNGGSWAWNWYTSAPWFDEFVHTYNPLAIVAASMIWLWRARVVTARPAGAAFIMLATGYGLVLGAGIEVIEAWFGDLLVHDTVSDLALDALGSAGGGALAGWVIRRSRLQPSP